MNWEQFAEVAPELAQLGWERFERQQLCLLGTLRAEGWPRIARASSTWWTASCCWG
jgi:hypothetical protein